jgi:hypothetical protein
MTRGWSLWGRVPRPAWRLWWDELTVGGLLAEPDPWPERGGQGMPPAESPFWSALRALNERLGAVPEALDLLERVRRGAADVLLVGQQPAILGGPLYNLHKALTAALLARAWGQRGGRPVAALFWGVTDDTDYGEASWTLLPREDLSLRKYRLPEGERVSGEMIGAWPREAWEAAWDEVAGPGDAGPWLEGLRRLPGEDFGRAFLALLLHLVSPHPLLVVDGRDPALLEAGQPLLERILASRSALAELLVRRSEAMREGGEAPALEPDVLDPPVFRVVGSRRHRLGEGPAGGLLAPNVVSRALLQSYLFPARAAVVGMGEIRYRAQIRDLYDALGIGRPRLVPRFSGLMLPSLAARLPSEWDPLDWVREPELARRRLEQDDGRAEAAFLALRERVEEGLAVVSRLGEAVDRSYPQMVDSARRKILSQIDRLEEGLRAKRRTRWYRRLPGLANLEAFLRPRGQEQDRSLSLLAPGLLYGPWAYGELAGWVERWIRERRGPDDLWEAYALGPRREAPGEQEGGG